VAAIAGSRVRLREDWTLLSWLLLLVHFLLFWNTLSILSIADWKCRGFVHIMSGPILLLFASSVISPPPGAFQPGALREHFLEVAKRFFIFLGLVQLWKLGTDLFFGGSFDRLSAMDAVTLVIVLVLAYSEAPRLQVAGTLAAWVMFLVTAALVGMQAAS